MIKQHLLHFINITILKDNNKILFYNDYNNTDSINYF